jgi:hypothetical protein
LRYGCLQPPLLLLHGLLMLLLPLQSLLQRQLRLQLQERGTA